MARYKALAKGWDGKRIIEPGEEFDFTGPPGSWMKELAPEVTEEEDTGEGAGGGAPPGGEQFKAELPDRKTVTEQLDAKGVSYFRGAPLDTLLGLLAKTEEQ